MGENTGCLGRYCVRWGDSCTVVPTLPEGLREQIPAAFRSSRIPPGGIPQDEKGGWQWAAESVRCRITRNALPDKPGANRRPVVAAVRWSAYVHDTPDANELAAIRRSGETGLPYGEDRWIDRLCRRLKLDLTIRPHGCPRKLNQ